MMRDVIDQNFTTKEVKFGMRKIISQFVKRVDPDLPFYYHSSFHTRFYEGSHPEFDKKSETTERKDCEEGNSQLHLLHSKLQCR